MSDATENLARRFPQHATTIPRLHARDPSFRSICEDYGEAQRTLDYWEAVGQAAPKRVAEYRQMLKELEAEALAILEAAQEARAAVIIQARSGKREGDHR